MNSISFWLTTHWKWNGWQSQIFDTKETSPPTLRFLTQIARAIQWIIIDISIKQQTNLFSSDSFLRHSQHYFVLLLQFVSCSEQKSRKMWAQIFQIFWCSSKLCKAGSYNEKCSGTKRKGSVTSSHCLVCSHSSWVWKTGLLMTGSEQMIPVIFGKIPIMAIVLFLCAKSRGKTWLLVKRKVVNNSYSLQVVSLLLSLFKAPSFSLSCIFCLCFWMPVYLWNCFSGQLPLPALISSLVFLKVSPRAL